MHMYKAQPDHTYLHRLYSHNYALVHVGACASEVYGSVFMCLCATAAQRSDEV